MPQFTNRQILIQVQQELRSLIKTIRGDPNNYKDIGLIGDVHNNTKFRKDMTKFKWYFIVAMLALWGTIIAQTILNGGQ